MQSDSSSMKTLSGADDGGKRQPPATVTAHRRGPALRQSEGVILAAIPACSPSPRGGQPGMICGGSPTETLWRVDGGESGIRQWRRDCSVNLARGLHEKTRRHWVTVCQL